MGLNHIYKVIWSKTKNAWVVVSEIAKRDGKSSVKSVVTSLAGKSVAAVMVAMVMCGGVASAFNHVGTNIAIGGDSLAVGEDIDSKGGQSLAIGIRAKSDGSGTTLVIGNDSKVVHTGMVVGNQSEGTYVIGQQSKGSFVLGNYSNSNHGGMVLGNNNSDDGIDASQITYAPINGVQLNYSSVTGGGATIRNTLSVGNKLSYQFTRITNVAAGNIAPDSTDAINGSQLYEAVRAVSAGASPNVYMHVNDGTTTQGAGNATTNLGKANEKGGATGNLAIAIGKDAKAQGNTAIAIGNSSTYANADSSIAMLGKVDSGSKASVAIGTGTRVQGERGTALGMSASTYGVGATALGAVSYAGADGSVSLGYYNSAYAKNSVVIGSFAGTENTAENSVAIGYGASVNYHTKDAVAIGGAQIGYFAMLGAGQEYSTSDNSNSIAIGNGVQVFSKNTVTIGSYDNRTRTLFHLTASTIPWQTDQNKLITPVTLTRQHMYGGTDTGYTEGTLGNSVYLGHESYAFTPNPLVDDDSHLTGEQSIHTKKYDATGNIVVSNNTTGGAFGKVSKATINGDEITGFAGSQSVGAVTIGAGDYERRIQNVAAGEVSATSTDGINGSQLYAVANTLSKNMSSYMHINDGTSTQTVGNATTNYGYSGSKAGATGTKAIAGGVNAQAAGEKAIAIGADATASSEATIAIGSNAKTQNINTIAIGKDAKATGNHSVALGGETESKGWHSVSVGYRAKNEGDNSISIGINASSDSTSNNSTVIGSNSSATINAGNSVILGMQSTIKGSVSSSANGIAIGFGSQINDSLAATAIGDSASISNLSNYGVGIGLAATVDNSAQGIALDTVLQLKIVLLAFQLVMVVRFLLH